MRHLWYCHYSGGACGGILPALLAVLGMALHQVLLLQSRP